jgi:hypothetical protein
MQVDLGEELNLLVVLAQRSQKEDQVQVGYPLGGVFIIWLGSKHILVNYVTLDCPGLPHKTLCLR